MCVSVSASLFIVVSKKVPRGFLGGSVGKEPTCNSGDTGDMGSILGSGRFPGEGHGYPLQYSCLENSMDRGAWQAAVLGVAKSQTCLSDCACARAHTHTHTHTHTGPTPGEAEAPSMTTLCLYTWLRGFNFPRHSMSGD